MLKLWKLWKARTGCVTLSFWICRSWHIYWVLRHLCTPGTFHTHNPATLIWNGQPAALRPSPTRRMSSTLSRNNHQQVSSQHRYKVSFIFPITMDFLWFFHLSHPIPHDLHLASSRSDAVSLTFSPSSLASCRTWSSIACSRAKGPKDPKDPKGARRPWPKSPEKNWSSPVDYPVVIGGYSGYRWL